MNWAPLETSTHQDHVIAHVVGATIRGYLLFDETAYLLLDIGFVWNIYLDGEMGLVPHPVFVKELNVSEDTRREVSLDVDLSLGERSEELTRMTRVTGSPIQSVQIFVREPLRRVVIACEDDRLTLETSLKTGEVKVMVDEDDELENVAAEEEQFVREQLQKEFGREPTDEEVNEWVREHTESY
jgi:hypothetical protein